MATDIEARNDQQASKAGVLCPPYGRQRDPEDNVLAQGTPFVTREVTTTITVKQEVVEVPLSSPIAGAVNPDRIRSLNHPPIHANDEAAPNVPELPRNTHAVAISEAVPSFTGPIPSLSTNRTFDSPNAMSNIATCFLDRCVLLFEHSEILTS